MTTATSPIGPHCIDALSRSLVLLSSTEFREQSLALLCETFDALCGRILIRWPTSSTRHWWAIDEEHADFFRGCITHACDAALAEPSCTANTYRNPRTDELVAILSVPLFNSDGNHNGCIALAVATDDGSALGERLHSLQQHALFLGPLLDSGRSLRGPQAASPVDDASLIENAISYTSVQDLATMICNRLCHRIGAHQVAMGRVRRASVELLAVSGLTTLNERSEDLQETTEAMMECLDLMMPAVSCREGSDPSVSRRGFPVHDQLRLTRGLSATISIPLVVDGKCEYVIHVQERDGTALDNTRVDTVRRLTMKHVPALLLIERATMPGLSRALNDLCTFARRQVLRRPLRRALQVGGVGALCLWLFAGTLPYGLSVPCVIEPQAVQVLVAPESARLVEAPLRPGDSVSTGQVVLRLDSTDLEVELQGVQSELAFLETNRRRALARRDAVTARLAEQEAMVLRSELESLQNRIDSRTARAAFDARVISGDLRRHIGETLPEGTELYQLATAGGWRVVLDVPEHRVVDLDKVLDCSISMRAQPEQSYPAQLVRVAPTAQRVDGEARYQAEALSDDLPGWVQPGMTGIFRLNLDARPTWRVLTKDTFDALYRQFFW